MLSFIITEKEGKKYSRLSGDFNKIHSDDLIGYNSIFGEKICHGTLILEKVIKIFDLDKKNFFNLSILFEKPFSYGSKIEFKKNKGILIQNDTIKAKILINKKYQEQNLIKNSKKKRFKIGIKIPKTINNNLLAVHLLRKISFFVGMVYPGQHSAIKSILINKRSYSYVSKLNSINISAHKIDQRFPIIKNKIRFRNFEIDFITIERPQVKYDIEKIEKSVKNKIKSIKNDVLIIGASSGIGNEVLNLFKINKKINIFATYHKNKINLTQKNISLINLDILKNIDFLKKKFKNFSKLYVYYFATPKIRLEHNEGIQKVYDTYYIYRPKKLISMFKSIKLNFFYPSSIYAKLPKTSYAKSKKKAEKVLIKLKNRKNKINILRITEVNTKQNLSIFNKKLPSFTKLLNNSKKYQKSFFFE